MFQRFKYSILKYHGKTVNIDHIEYPITTGIEKYKNYPIIVPIKSKTQISISNLIVLQNL